MAHSVSLLSFVPNQDPSKPIKLVVPYPPGGVVDFLGRLFAEHLARGLGQPLVIENRPGAGTNIGSQYVAASAPDGYTLLIGSSANTVNMTLYKTPGYDVEKDFAPVAIMVTTPNLLLSNKDFPATSLGELIDLAKKQRLRYASAGNGSPSHMAGEQFVRAVKVQLEHVPYKGAAPAAVDVLAGRVELLFSNIPATIGHVKGGSLRAIAVSGSQRSPALPDVPTFAESGLPSYDADAWYGLLAPAGTPPAVIKRLNDEIGRLLVLPEVSSRLLQNGTVPVQPSSPSDFASLIRKDVRTSRDLVKSSGISIQ